MNATAPSFVRWEPLPAASLKSAAPTSDSLAAALRDVLSRSQPRPLRPAPPKPVLAFPAAPGHGEAESPQADLEARIDALGGRELSLETGRLLTVLRSHPQGMSREQLVREFYPNYERASASLQRSLEGCLNKIIQRSRARFRALGLDISYSRTTRLWLLESRAAPDERGA